MRGGLTRAACRRAVPALDGAVRGAGLRAADVRRDPAGVSHVQAASVHDAFVAQGLIHAQDRL